MKLSVMVAPILAASAEAAAFQRRQNGYPSVDKCGLDAFQGHTSEAALFCSSILRSGTATSTLTLSGITTTVTSTHKVTTTIVAPSSTTSKTPTPTPTPTQTPSPTPTPTPTGAPSCGIIGYVRSTPAYYFESSGTQASFGACGALCRADARCESFGYGEADCMLFDVSGGVNTNVNPTSPYTFYDKACGAGAAQQRRRQIEITLPLPGGGIAISLGAGLGSPAEISSACSCFITKGPAETTVTTTTSAVVTTTVGVTDVVTKSAA
ncbi:hypothetical protein ACEQ8H_007616 [Pleosporales sp. CAS-2024a]